MPKQENGQIVETAIEARGAERGPTMRNGLEPWPGGGSLRGDLFRVLKNLNSVVGYCWSAACQVI
jgi:hypothetical protein